MRWPRPRFTMRRLMVAVAVVALFLGAANWVIAIRARSAAYYRRSYEFETMMSLTGSAVFLPDGRMIDRYDNDNSRLHDEWALRMAAKYWDLSIYPWRDADPDAPPPAFLAHPKSAFELPAKDDSFAWERDFRKPAWTFLWTWER